MTRRVLGGAGLVLHFTVVAFFYLLTPMVAPMAAAAALVAVWLALAGLGWWLLQRGSRWTIAVPFVAAGVWFGVLALGDAYLGWTA